MATIIQGYKDSSDLLDKPRLLRERAGEDGYLFFRQLLPEDVVLELRKQILQILAKYGWVDESKPLMEAWADIEAIRNEDVEKMTAAGVGVHAQAYKDIQCLELFHKLPHHPKLIDIYNILFDGPVLPHPRHIARLMLPADFNKATPPHQDHIHIQGTENVWTSWLPLGDIPKSLGNLSVIPGSHKAGLMTVAPAEGAGGLAAQLCGNDHQWIEDDFKTGDVLMFPSLTIHKSITPTNHKNIRLSVDYRYQSASEVIEEGSLGIHAGVATWEEVYENWESDDLQYYWKKHKLSFKEWDDSIRWQKEKIC